MKNTFVDDISDEEIRQELGEPPYQFEKNLEYKLRLERKPLQSRHEWLFTWKAWFKRLFITSSPTPFEQRGRYHDYPRYLSSGIIFPILLRKTYR